MTSGVCVIDELVVDTSALISWPITELSGAVIVKSQIQELERHSPSRGHDLCHWSDSIWT